jgi:UDP-glucose 4-epimerase
MSRIIVTGGAGFIGSNVARLLADQGHEVIVLDDLSHGYEHLIDQRCRFIRLGLAEAGRLPEALDGATAVMHFAASSIIARSFTNPMEYVQNNVVNATNLLEAMRQTGVRKLVFSSSASVYGEPERVPVHEGDPKRPLQMYGATKLAFEEVLHAYNRSFGISSVSLRYFNAYGPGDLQQPVTRAVPRWIQAALTNRPLRMYWKGEQYRDYVFVDDIARAHIEVLPLEGYHVFNVGSGDGILMKDVAGRLGEITGRQLTIEDAGERPGDPMRLVADVSRIREAVGWEARTPLREGLAEAVRFYEGCRPMWEPRLADE